MNKAELIVITGGEELPQRMKDGLKMMISAEYGNMNLCVVEDVGEVIHRAVDGKNLFILGWSSLIRGRNDAGIERELSSVYSELKSKKICVDIEFLDQEMLSRYILSGIEKLLHRNFVKSTGFTDTPTDEIQSESFRMISDRTKKYSKNPKVRSVMIRMIHAGGDISLENEIEISFKAVDNAVQALRNKCSIITDVRMVAAGISTRFRSNVFTAVAQDGLHMDTLRKGMTKSAAGIEVLKERIDGSVIVIGNAPTALIQLLRIFERTGAIPSVVIGCPLGFVGAAESKEELVRSGIEYITVRGNRGGSSIAASALNGVSEYL